ncbi:MAG: ribosomal-protein-alanine N-acetyltransferase [Cellvibrionales bacterium TMED49]|nr:MAG: ribosomal-protein-alanine N-acetyltransferase [Cellvibrionales bacterium TMED49]
MYPAHLHSVVSIERRVSPNPWKMSQFRESLQHHNGSVLLVGEHVRGFTIHSIGMEQADLLNIGLQPSFQGQGLGRRLVKSIIRQLPAGIKKIMLEVRVSNWKAIRLYKTMGFKIIDLRKDYYSNWNEQTRENALVMLRLLS